MSRSKDLADSAEVINFLDNISTDINSGLTSKLSTSTNLSDLADADVALVNLGLIATATELNYTDGVTSAIQTQLDTKLASASYTASDVLTKVKTVDGAASGLDADLLDGQQGSYYTSYTDTAISNLVDSAPGALDTLNELAAALGDDANFSTTVTNSIALKAPLASPTFTGTVTIPAATVTGDVSFGDSDKAIFGVGSDLQIYHDGSASYIDEQGTGDLRIKGTSMSLKTSDNETYALFTANGASTLYYDNAAKLATTASGIEVNDAVIAMSHTGNTSTISFTQKEGTQNSVATITANREDSSTSASRLLFSTNNGTSTLERMRIYNNGNISFYEDTGTTAKFFWDASAERLGIGTSSPSQALEIAGSVRIDNGASFTAYEIYRDNILYGSVGGGSNQFTLQASNSKSINLFEDSGVGLTVKDGGNVGIGTTSPATNLQIESSTGGNAYLSVKRNNATSTDLRIAAENGSTGISSVGAVPMAFYTNSVERMRIDATGNVGIGISSPTYKLHVRSADASDDVAYIHHDNASQSSGTLLKVRSDAGASNGYSLLDVQNNSGTALYVAGDNKVGIGTTSPVNKLHLLNAGTTAISDVIANSGMIVDGGSGNAALNLITGGAGYCYVNFGDSTDSNIGRIFYQHTDNSMVFSTNVAERMRIDSSGNVGIGVTDPSVYNALGSTRNFVVGSSGGSTVTITSGTSSYGHLAFATGTATDNDEYLGLIQYYHVDNSMRLYTNSTEKLRIASSGNVGIGTSSPTGFSGYTSLDINNATNGAIIDLSQGDVMKGRLVATASTMAIETSSSVPIIFQPAGTEAMRINSSGNVGIGTTSPVISSGYTSLTLNNATNSGYLVLQNNGTTKMDMYVSGGSVPTLRSISSALSLQATGANVITFTTNNTERMRIDSTGSVYIGSTSDSGTGYHRLSVDGFVRHKRAGDVVAIFDRGTSDGDIVLLRKDGATVGNIGTKSSGMYIGTDDAGIFFNHHGGGDLDAIFPYDVGTNTFYNGHVDIGGPSNRFKNAHFSGTVNANAFSGDGSALTNLPASGGGGEAFSSF
jgi:hypothetical protein